MDAAEVILLEDSDADSSCQGDDESSSKPMDVVSDSDDQTDNALPPRSKAHFMEIYSPARVSRHVERRGLVSAGSYDLLTECDMLTWQGRAKVLRNVLQLRPLMLVSSPPCTMFSELMRLWNLKKMKYEVRKLRQREAMTLLDFGMEVCEIQDSAGRFWVHEHPHRASSWRTAKAS